MQYDAVVACIVIAGQGQPGPVPVLGVSGQSDAVIGRVGFLGQHGDPPGTIGVASPQRLDESMSDHAVSDHDHMLG
jgi:hypothetical protein